MIIFVYICINKSLEGYSRNSCFLITYLVENTGWDGKEVSVYSIFYTHTFTHTKLCEYYILQNLSNLF